MTTQKHTDELNPVTQDFLDSIKTCDTRNLVGLLADFREPRDRLFLEAVQDVLKGRREPKGDRPTEVERVPFDFEEAEAALAEQSRKLTTDHGKGDHIGRLHAHCPMCLNRASETPNPDKDDPQDQPSATNDERPGPGYVGLSRPTAARVGPHPIAGAILSATPDAEEWSAWARQFSAALDGADREGHRNTRDDPEGTVWITVSDTFAKATAHRLRALAGFLDSVAEDRRKR